ncbi:unnamed protein product [Ilex paraguariensis]|uniref:Uncharacterized protein n=1 Tax=Ilex paraguariensis TaxID=185542 RepID=A0ABC8RKV1_9AQUA
MLSFGEGEEFFFDTVDCLSSEESVVGKEDLVYDNLGYEIWINEPKSVKERRESFLRGLGFVEFASSAYGLPLGEESMVMPLDRIRECSGAISSSFSTSIASVKENLGGAGREMHGEANCMLDESDQDQSDDFAIALDETAGTSGHTQTQAHIQEFNKPGLDKKKMRSWWKHIINKMKINQGKLAFELSKPKAEKSKIDRMKVRQNKKRCMEFSAVYAGQELCAHNGLIWTMKFSPDGQYLASGGEDGVVRIWRVTLADTSCKSIFAECNFTDPGNGGKSVSGRKKSSHASVIIPDKVFQIEELPVQELHGHTSDVLDLAWSKSNCLLSSSKDRTVRLWQVGSDDCLNVFQHNNYVTCIQFNPADESYFISGSIDGKVRIWGVSEGQVLDWANARDVVTAICYQPNGKGFIVGSITGTCRFFEVSGGDLQLNAEIHIHGRKKSSGNKITGIQFTQEESPRIMITSDDSKVRILDGIDVVHKYRGLPKSGSQMSASFTSTGRHIVSIGEDSRIYVWNYDNPSIPSSKQPKSVRSCEHFFFEGVSVAIPWSGIGTEQKGSSLITQDPQGSSCVRDSERFSLASWFSMDGSCKGSVTWPEERLPLWDIPVSEHEHDDPLHSNHDHCCQVQHQRSNASHSYGVSLATWGLVIVTAGRDGMIRTFHNYGLPVRI